MKIALKHGGPAFPGMQAVLVGSEQGGYQTEFVPHPGLSMRDYFAAAALPEAIRQTAMVSSLAVPPEPRSNAARIAYEIADAMLAEREKTL